MLLSLQGLRAGEHVLCALRDGWAEELTRFLPGADGSAVITVPTAGKVFVTDGQSVVLWEEEGGAEINYWQAAAQLHRATTQRPFEEAADAPQTEPVPENAPEEPEAAPSLRPQSEGEPVDALPALRWPEEVRHLKPYFEAYVPFAPFDAPGWRFVRLPSPLRNVPYCAVGVCAGGGAVTQVAYAVPGSPLRAPAALPGYRYQKGRSGQGYWTLWKTVREE